MLTKEDMQAVKSVVGESETRMTEKIDGVENRLMAFIESAIIPQLRILAEGQQTILQTLAPKNRVEDLEEEVRFLKNMLGVLADRVTDLEKGA